MSLPKPTEENINLSEDDLKKTKDMEILTKDIQKLIEEEEDEISNFYRHFSSFEIWVRQNMHDVEKLKGIMLDKLTILRDHVDKAISLLQNILLMTKSEQKLNSKKIMLKLDISKDFDAEKAFAKELNYPRDIVKLAKKISTELQKTGSETDQDLKVEHKTEKLISNMIDMFEHIKPRLQEFEKFVLGEHLENAEQQIHALVENIQRERMAFERLDSFEKVHLNLLMQLYDEEKNTVAQESLFADDEKKAQKPKY